MLSVPRGQDGIAPPRLVALRSNSGARYAGGAEHLLCMAQCAAMYPHRRKRADALQRPPRTLPGKRPRAFFLFALVSIRDTPPTSAAQRPRPNERPSGPVRRRGTFLARTHAAKASIKFARPISRGFPPPAPRRVTTPPARSGAASACGSRGTRAASWQCPAR